MYQRKNAMITGPKAKATLERHLIIFKTNYSDNQKTVE